MQFAASIGICRHLPAPLTTGQKSSGHNQGHHDSMFRELTNQAELGDQSQKQLFVDQPLSLRAVVDRVRP